MVQGIRRWGPHFSNCYLHVITDNMQVLAMLCTGRSANKTCMTWLKEIFWMCFIWNIDIHPSYIKSADNCLADALSCLPYKGVPSSCNFILGDLNMCCSSPYRPLPTSAEETSETPARRGTGRLNKDLQAMPVGLL